MNLKKHYEHTSRTPMDVELQEKSLFRQLCKTAQVKCEKQGLSAGEAVGQSLSLLLYEVTEGLFKGGEEDEEELHKFLESFYDTFNQWRRIYHD